MSQQSGGVSGSCGSNLVRESAYWSLVGICYYPRLAEYEPGQLNYGGQIPTGWCAHGIITVATIPLDFAGSDPACVLLSSVLSAVMESCLGFTLQTFSAKNPRMCKVLTPQGEATGDVVKIIL